MAYGRIVRERSVLRQLIGTANQIADSAFTPDGRDSNTLLDLAEQAVYQIAEQRTTDGGPEKVGPLLAKAIEKVELLTKTKGAITGLATGFTDLEKKPPDCKNRFSNSWRLVHPWVKRPLLLIWLSMR